MSRPLRQLATARAAELCDQAWTEVSGLTYRGVLRAAARAMRAGAAPAGYGTMWPACLQVALGPGERLLLELLCADRDGFAAELRERLDLPASQRLSVRFASTEAHTIKVRAHDDAAVRYGPRTVLDTDTDTVAPSRPEHWGPPTRPIRLPDGWARTGPADRAAVPSPTLRDTSAERTVRYPGARRPDRSDTTITFTRPAGLELVVAGGRIVAVGVERVVLGRSFAADVRVEDELVSRHHLAVHADGDVLVATDLGSANGTWLAGRRLTGPVQVAAGTRLSLAGTVDVEVRAARAGAAGRTAQTAG